MSENKKIALLGGAGLVGQNLALRLKKNKLTNILVVDKHKKNLTRMKELNPGLECIFADLSVPGDWQTALAECDVVVMLQAQIGGLNREEFVSNNIRSTQLILETIKKDVKKQLIHISSSVVNSVANDLYTETKIEQEAIVLKSTLNATILRPTLMFGWFDRKHLGWLSKFMKNTPVFPIPGSGEYLRQPLYVGDFCEVIISSIKKNHVKGVFDITGQEKINYIDLIKLIKKSLKLKTLIVKIPYSVFYYLLKIWSVFDNNPPFTSDQLIALVAGDVFQSSDWPNIFAVEPTPLSVAIDETFCDPRYSKIYMEF